MNDDAPLTGVDWDKDYWKGNIMSNKQQPNAAQTRWLDDIERWCHNRNFYLFQMHHVVGRTYIHNKVPIGHWFILPIAIYLHDVNSDNPFNVTHFPKAFTDEFGMQRDIFSEMVGKMCDKGYIVPDEVILDAIADTKY